MPPRRHSRLTLVKPLNDDSAYRAVLAERAVLARLQGGCTLPIAAWARDLNSVEPEREDTMLAIDAGVFAVDGSQRVVVTLQGPRHDPEVLGRRAGQTLIDRGALLLLAQIGLPGDR